MMVDLKLSISETLAQKIEPLTPWLPTVLELSLVGFQTRATRVASDIISFLSSNPTSKAVLDYQLAPIHQERTQRLLELNKAHLLGADEQLELDELEKIEHIIIMLKASTLQQK
ncbi:MAG: hypothetical protein AAF614_12610 [Chloroflexota bacterium]